MILLEWPWIDVLSLLEGPGRAGPEPAEPGQAGPVGPGRLGLARSGRSSPAQPGYGRTCLRVYTQPLARTHRLLGCKNSQPLERAIIKDFLGPLDWQFSAFLEAPPAPGTPKIRSAVTCSTIW